MDDQGIFELHIPISWKYFLMDGYIHTFQEYEGQKADCFQLSLRGIKDAEEKRAFADYFGHLPPTDINGIDYRSYEDNESDEDSLVVKTWTTIWGETEVLFSLTYDKESEALLDEKLKGIYEVIGSLHIWEDGERIRRLSSYRFEMFLQGIGASVVILGKAIENMAFIEATCLLANQLDSLLRISIVLKEQILMEDDSIGTEWIYQGPRDKKKSEKDIYKKAKEIGVIGDGIYEDLFRLYEDRNRVIHRFIISEITLAEVETIAYNYYTVREKVKMIVDDIESEQIRLGIGMTVLDDRDPGNKCYFLNFALGKIGKLNYFGSKEER